MRPLPRPSSRTKPGAPEISAGRPVEHGALRHEAPDRAVEPGHGSPPARNLDKYAQRQSWTAPPPVSWAGRRSRKLSQRVAGSHLRLVPQWPGGARKCRRMKDRIAFAKTSLRSPATMWRASATSTYSAAGGRRKELLGGLGRDELARAAAHEKRRNRRSPGAASRSRSSTALRTPRSRSAGRRGSAGPNASASVRPGGGGGSSSGRRGRSAAADAAGRPRPPPRPLRPSANPSSARARMKPWMWATPRGSIRGTTSTRIRPAKTG